MFTRGRRVMRKARMNFVVPIVIVILGVSWLLDSLDVAPGVNWVRTVGLATAGVLVPVIGGIDKLTVVMCPFLITTSVCELMRQTGSLKQSEEMPILLIVLGALVLVEQILRIRTPNVLKSRYQADDEKRR